MLFFHLKSSLPILKTAMASALLMGAVQLIVGCDSQPSSSNNDGTTQADTVDKDMANNDEISVNPAPTDTSAMDKAQTNEAADIANEQIVSLSGYQKLSFGQTITPELLNGLGMTKAKSDNEQCYYVSNPELSYVDKEYGERASVLYQIIDDKVALISIQDPSIPFYKDTNVGNLASEVMKAHNDELSYEVDKYAVDGDYYSLIANVNFKVIKESPLGEFLKDGNVELNNKQDNLPLQIEYHIKGGQKLSNSTIKATEWTADYKNLLKGEVESIAIGIPEAIYLVEGCS